MSGADDQRAAGVPNDVARRWLAERDEARKLLAETRDRRDYLQGQLDIIYDAEYSRNDALKRRIEKMGTAGDALADAATETLRWSGLPSELWALLADARDAYRAARDAAPADEIDRLRARAAELETASPDDAHTTTETWTEYRVTYAETDDVDLFEDLASAEHWGQFIGGDTGARVESREVTVTRTETAWTEAQP